jgi:hypothetical protein
MHAACARAKSPAEQFIEAENARRFLNAVITENNTQDPVLDGSQRENDAEHQQTHCFQAGNTPSLQFIPHAVFFKARFW